MNANGRQCDAQCAEPSVLQRREGCNRMSISVPMPIDELLGLLIAEPDKIERAIEAPQGAQKGPSGPSQRVR
jgi:hypothetical protein